MEDYDLLLAQQLQEQFNQESVSVIARKNDAISNSTAYSSDNSSASLPLSVIDPSWETTDPNPDIHALFIQYNDQYFWGRLTGVEVKWSPRMTLCAGVCSYEGRGGLCSIRLSVPLLKLRPRKDLVETLLHEMIHAYLFVTENDRDRDGHGPNFQKHMHRINKASGAKITIYHDFHDEVNSYRQHWWRCNGPCKSRPPYYGWVKRAMNRAPSEKDWWWPDHARSCGGTYTKVKEPEGYGEKKKGKKDQNSSSSKAEQKGANGTVDIRTFWGKGNTLGSSNPKRDTTAASIPSHKKTSTVTSNSGQSSQPDSQPYRSKDHLPANKGKENTGDKQTSAQPRVQSWGGGGIWTTEKNISSSKVSPEKSNPGSKPNSSSLQGGKGGAVLNQPKTWTVVETDKDKAVKTNSAAGPQDIAGYVLGKGSGQKLSWLAQMRQEWVTTDRGGTTQSVTSVLQETGMPSSVSKPLNEGKQLSSGHLGTSSKSGANFCEEEKVEANKTDSSTFENESFMSSEYSFHDSFHVSSCEEDSWPSPEAYKTQKGTSNVCEEKRKRTVIDLVSSDEECDLPSVFKRSKSAIESSNKPGDCREAMVDSACDLQEVKAKIKAGAENQTNTEHTNMPSTSGSTNGSGISHVKDEKQFRQTDTPDYSGDRVTSAEVQAGAALSPRASRDSSEEIPGNSRVACPVCQTKVPADEINQHLDICLS